MDKFDRLPGATYADSEAHRRRGPGTTAGDAAQAAKINEARLRALVDASPLGIDIMDLQGHPVFYNPKCEELHGISLADANGEGWTRAIHPDDRERVVRTWYEAARAGKSWAETYRFLHPDGRVVWVSGRAAPMQVDGEHIGFVGTLEDITEHKEAEIERERLLARERAAREEAERATQLRDDTVAAVAHELRNPLQTLAVSAGAMLAQPPVDPRSIDHIRRQLGIMQRTIAKMDGLVRDLLDVSRLESGTLEVRRKPLHLDMLIAETREQFEGFAAERGISLTASVDPGLPTVVGDHSRLAQVLSNLIDNALKFTGSGGRVTVLAQPQEHHVLVSVEDTGPGIAAEWRERVFDRFWQVDRTSRAGSGLGLAIAAGIVNAHGGRIWVDSEREQGAAFRFTVPTRAFGQ